jgi:hypothetical protein
MPTRTEKLDSEHLPQLLEGEGGEPTMPFGDWLVRRGLIDRGQLFFALNLAFRVGFRVGDALVCMNALPRLQIEEEAQRHVTFRSFTGVL